MSLLHDIQVSLMQEEVADIGSVLLKLRFLASALGSDLMEEWIRHEVDGYPEGIPVPDYRQIGVSYEGTFHGAYGYSIQNVPIPPYLIKKYAGERWVEFEMRQSVAAVDDLIQSTKSKKNATLQIDAANLILILQGKIYKGMACNSITGFISIAELAALQFSVRKQVLELTIQLEKAIPAAGEIVIGKQSAALPEEAARTATHITHQTIYTDSYTVISNNGAGLQSVSVLNINKGDVGAFEKALIEGGITKTDASELAKIVSKEEPQSQEEPFGERAKAWIAMNIDKVAKGSWQVGKEVVMKLLTEAATQYYFK